MLERYFLIYKLCWTILCSYVGDDFGEGFCCDFLEGSTSLFNLVFPCVFPAVLPYLFVSGQVLATRGREGQLFFVGVLQVLQQQIRSAQEATRRLRT